MKITSFRVVGALGLVVLLIWLITPFVVTGLALLFPPSAVLGQVGDIFGMTNSLFAGFGFLGLCYTILLQLEANSETRREVAAQIRLSGLAARLTALPLRIDLEKARLRTFLPGKFAVGKEYGIETLEAVVRFITIKSLAKTGMEEVQAKADAGTATVWEQDALALSKHEDEILSILLRLIELLREVEDIHAQLKKGV